VPYGQSAFKHRAWAYEGSVVRFAVGLEGAGDLQADIEQALMAIAV
jgi:cystathionine beta-lyase